jgi:hypothetical protein
MYTSAWLGMLHKTTTFVISVVTDLNGIVLTEALCEQNALVNSWTAQDDCFNFLIRHYFL